MKRWAWNFLCGLSLALFVLTGAAWVRGHFFVDWISWRREGHRV
jgi:hypothetical protein